MMFCSVKNATKQSLYQNVPNVTDILQRYGIIVKVINQSLINFKWIINNINIDKQQHSVKKTTKQCLYQSVPNATDKLHRYEIIVNNVN